MAENGRRKEDCFFLAVASGQSVRDASASAGIGERTGHRWLALPDAQQRLSELRGQMVAETLGKLTAALSESADTLRALLKSKNGWLRLSSARAIQESAMRLREHTEMEARLQRLEEAQKKGGRR